MKLYSTNEVARMLECTTRNVCYLVQKGDLTPINPHKRFFLFDQDEVLTYKQLRDERK